MPPRAERFPKRIVRSTMIVEYLSNPNPSTTTTKPFIPGIWGRLHEPKENYAGSGT